MEAVNKITKKDQPQTTIFDAQDKLALGHIKYAQGVGASLRYANELRAVKQQIGRLPPLGSSHLHEDVLRGKLNQGAVLSESEFF